MITARSSWPVPVVVSYHWERVPHMERMVKLYGEMRPMYNLTMDRSGNVWAIRNLGRQG